MAKAITLPFPEKTASELASRLGVSKARQKRIFTLVERARKTSKSRTAKKSVAFSSRPRQRSNAKAAR